MLLQIDAVVSDFSAAYNRAVDLDVKIMEAAGKVSGEYVDLVSLATRQTFGSMDITVLGSNGSSEVNSSDVKIFVKDIGTSQ